MIQYSVQDDRDLVKILLTDLRKHWSAQHVDVRVAKTKDKAKVIFTFNKEHAEPIAIVKKDGVVHIQADLKDEASPPKTFATAISRVYMLQYVQRSQE